MEILEGWAHYRKKVPINPESLCDISASGPKRTEEFKDMQMMEMVQVYSTSYGANMKKMNAIKNVLMAYQ